MIKKFVLTILLFSIPFLSEAQMKVGVMDPDGVLDALPETAQVQQQLQQYVQDRQEEYVTRYQSFIEEIGEFEEQVESGLLDGQQRQQREVQLAEREEELESLGNRIQNQIQTRQNELLAPIMQRVEVAMEAVAQELELDYVLNRMTGRGEPVVYYVSDRGVDITNQVIQRLLE